MKRTIIATLILASAVIPSFATSPDKIIKRFRNVENVDYVHLPKFLIKMGLATAAKNVPMASSVSGITVLDLSDASATVRNQFVKEIDNISGYETLVSSSDGDEKALILTKPKGDKFEDFLIVSVDSSDCSLVLLEGKFSQKELNAMIEKESKE